MADEDRTPPDLLGSLLTGRKQAPAQEQVSQPADIPVSQQAGIPARQPTIKPARKKADSKPKQAQVKEQEAAPGDKVKATFYLSTDIVEGLEEGWIQLRKLTPKKQRGQVSKSLIVELALRMALDELSSKGDKSQMAKQLSSKL